LFVVTGGFATSERPVVTPSQWEAGACYASKQTGSHDHRGYFMLKAIGWIILIIFIIGLLVVLGVFKAIF
jgi:hypothetical protein